MIIPVKCVTCGMVLGDKFRYYTQRVQQMKIDRGMNPREVLYIEDLIRTFGDSNIEPAPEAIVLNELMLNKVCCRRHMLTHVDIM